MKKTLFVVIVTALFATGATAATLPDSLIRPHGGTQSLTFDDLGSGGGGPTSGTYDVSSGSVTFGFDVFLTFNGYNASGLSFWLETNTAFAGNLSVTGMTYGTTFSDPTQPTPATVLFNSDSGASPGFKTETRDFGSTGDPFNPTPPGTYFVAHITFTIAMGAAPANYILQSTVVSPHTSVATSNDGSGGFADENIPATQYLFALIPEPTTFDLIAMAALAGLGFLAHRRHRQLRSGLR